MLMGLAICMAQGLVIFMILMYLISMIPFIGPYITGGITWVITKIAVYAGVANCGYKNDFNEIQDAEQ
jgi:hypothetical protein